MKKGIYSRLALTGIKKNKKLYIPYILTCIGMVMMFYIITFLSSSDMMMNYPGGETMRGILGFGVYVIGFFAVIFLFYTNSFLVRRRKKEFGLYNILGMGKRNIARVMLWETLFIGAFSIAVGMALGVLFSKLAELVMVNIMSMDVTFGVTIDYKAIYYTVVLFAVIFFLILLNSLRQVHLSNPIALLHSENAGEKPPKANWFFAVLGVLILGCAYYLAVTIKDPVTTLAAFFFAVIMVIIATYLIFISGSVAFCKILQKKKNYYYKTNHFVSVSSMSYRMKRNGAGLASICILCTMVLVMISSTVCLYLGKEDSLRERYPRNINITMTSQIYSDLISQDANSIAKMSIETAENMGYSPENFLDYSTLAFVSYIRNGEIVFDDGESGFDYATGDLWQIFMVPLEDYNRITGSKETLENNEVLISTSKDMNYGYDTVSIKGQEPLNIKTKGTNFENNGVDTMQIIPALYIFVPDLGVQIERISQTNAEALETVSRFIGFDLNASDTEQVQVYDAISDNLRNSEIENPDSSLVVSVESASNEKQSFYGLFGGLFFLGIILGIVFIFAAVLIMYYKQISEGYEDQSRFEIMQKVGMTKREIKKSINSQMLTVFFMPLIASGVHLAFAFPMIYKMLILFGLVNKVFLIMVTVGCFLLFALLYMLVYKITSRAYYSIVSGGKEK
ncbi:ABC transporter permease [Anaeromassilibacillus sp. An172]|uniref:ABC transporter permease n=1 Tax=Anaeromassilibacillus sp. An172 TaxID=1965570 RepID=UPI000B397567|nr:ABC transporter permease [Anaeromassilibacillus sp. An172]OUP79325.1 ABC transporter permease [Anaeromassilibacillus sp. An172]